MITQKQFNTLFYWDADKIRIWRKITRGGQKAGKEAGGVSSQGYWKIMIFGMYYKRADLVWWRETGVWPDKENGFVIDHKDTYRLNDEFSNLQEITHVKNCSRFRKHYTTNKTGVPGVSWHKTTKKWLAQIRTKTKATHLGLFTDFDDAVNARKKAEKRILGGFTP